jgi:hypothetical protein
MKAINCLLITTSNNRLGDSLNKTGVWLEDLAALMTMPMTVNFSGRRWKIRESVRN